MTAFMEPGFGQVLDQPEFLSGHDQLLHGLGRNKRRALFVLDQVG